MSYYIIIRGPLGCGKSTISKKLIESLNAKYFAVDRVLDKYNLTEDKEEGYISQRSFIKANDIIVPKIKEYLEKNTIIILDGNFYWKSQIEDLISKLNYPHYIFTLKAPLKICIERDSKRNKTHGKDAAMVVYKKSTSFKYGIIIDVTKPLGKIIKEIISYLPKD